ncbi:hypothetical protein TrST_g9330 [Triparma strigata]|uniref:Deacetylase sirtuin-type domain-containing protein n=1 Tax=Triparma strigata TaxID=1606541 RepID=A0A9W7CAF6_9STRA|nr:hypothetical protein TrST_g9330 [Triparma strigata]
MSSFNVNPDQQAPDKEPTGLAGLASRFVQYRDEQAQHDSDDDSADDHESDHDDDSESTDSGGAHGVDPDDPSLGLVERLLAARARSSPDQADKITAILNSLNLGIDFTPPPRVLKTHVFGEANTPPTLSHLASLFKTKKYSKILVLTGAGISVAAGIPDFRTAGTGLYSNLEKYNLPHPTAVFDIDFYKDNPAPFVMLASEIWPGNHLPTKTHAFIKLLSDKGILLRNYTQNIDGLEVLGGVPEEKVIECHGHFRTASCTSCGSPMDVSLVSKSIIEDGVPPVCAKCGGIGKPDIVFFGEDLPSVFHGNINRDVKEADMIIVMGTSLQVQPVAGIPDYVSSKVPRLLFNREHVGNFDTSEYNYRDIFEAGNCDDGVENFCEMIGWGEELRTCYENAEGRRKLREEKITSEEEID